LHGAVTRWRHAERDVLARVETLRRGDRIYLPGHHLRGPARVVAAVEIHPEEPARPGLPARPATAIVSYFTGARARPLDGVEPGDAGELIVQQLRPFELGTRLRVRRVVAA
jgi:hypothetical protein